MRIYLGDLTYTTLSIATEAFPLNIGYVGAYCKKVFGDKVELQLFKYVEDLERAVLDAPPDVLALSNYPWNERLAVEMLTWAKSVRPTTLGILGGSNIPHEPQGQEAFLRERPCVDAYVYLEGELGFAALMERVVDVDEQERRAAIHQAPIPGCLYVGPDGGFVRGPVHLRQKALDEFPSPYLSGLMDPFFDGRLSPMLETNRGCPFRCTYCHEGHGTYNKVNFFSMERVRAELDYVAERIPSGVHNLMFSDPNFGMYPRDTEICDIIAGYQKDKGWPQDVFASTGKNMKDRIVASLNKLNGAMQMWLSVQSMDHGVLKNIKRDNIRLSDMMGIQSTLKRQKTPSKSEIILGLPGETLQSHTRSLANLVDAGIDAISTYQLMLLHGTEMNTPAERERWGFQSRFRILPRCFGKLNAAGRNVIEVEEIVVATKDLSFEDYVQARRLHFIVSVAYNGKPFAALFKLLAELEMDTFPLLEAAMQRIDEAPAVVRELVAGFERETRAELWDSADDIQAFYSQDGNYDKLLSGEYGANLLQKYTALSLFSAAEEWAGYIFDIAAPMIVKDDNAVSAEAIESLRRYCIGRVSNIFGSDRKEQRYAQSLTHDIDAWASDLDGLDIEAYRLDSPETYEFVVSASQYQIAEDYLQRFGRTHQGIGKTLTKLNIINAWRHCVREGMEPMGTDVATMSAAYALIDEQASGGIITKR